MTVKKIWQPSLDDTAYLFRKTETIFIFESQFVSTIQEYLFIYLFFMVIALKNVKSEWNEKQKKKKKCEFELESIIYIYNY
ncbi:hypothetical protein Phum_PHUM578420 [Pediculus humanus corporis]|uniref:Uncharacterized protein n=1 Tax=Pediculus humanus subsp. corporis TaxID=121224 RepID=E0W1K5_PEDHC|nr:uncharacterized protein Phum_PHUM578420 [Pediculus humanus corporis]EEB19511.1 hypothetical protein Phum_PHUM578420 [Pediculus humanus corporis]